jgi:hypothetical protein
VINCELARIFEQYIQSAKLIEDHGTSLYDYYIGLDLVNPIESTAEAHNTLDLYYDGEELMELTDEVEANMFPADETPMQLTERFSLSCTQGGPKKVL